MEARLRQGIGKGKLGNCLRIWAKVQTMIGEMPGLNFGWVPSHGKKQDTWEAPEGHETEEWRRLNEMADEAAGWARDGRWVREAERRNARALAKRRARAALERLWKGAEALRADYPEEDYFDDAGDRYGRGGGRKRGRGRRPRWVQQDDLGPGGDDAREEGVIELTASDEWVGDSDGESGVVEVSSSSEGGEDGEGGTEVEKAGMVEISSSGGEKESSETERGGLGQGRGGKRRKVTVERKREGRGEEENPRKKARSEKVEGQTGGRGRGVKRTSKGSEEDEGAPVAKSVKAKGRGRGQADQIGGGGTRKRGRARGSR